MDRRNVGSTGLISSAIGLGSLAFTGRYGRVTDSECIRTIHHALDEGITMLDTAGFYAAGRVERLIGRAVAGRRDTAVIATRGGARVGADGRPTSVDGRPQTLHDACDASLRSLSVDHVDLFYLAGVDPLVPVEDSVGALAGLVAAGKVRYIGLSEASEAELRRAHAVHPITALSSEYSVWDRRVETESLPAARELGVGLVACRPLSRGLLTGRIVSSDQLDEADYRRDDPRFAPGNLEHNLSLLPAMERVAADLDLGLTRLALAWLLSHDDVVPIPSTRSSVHLEMIVAAAAVRLAPGQRARLVRLFPPGAVAGEHPRGLP